MLRIKKNIEPDFLLKFKRKNIPKTWYDYNNGTIKSEIKVETYDVFLAFSSRLPDPLELQRRFRL